ncbi:MAG TPA: DUF2793 domain-containing protein [Rhizomicrobium sp.]|jgi:hypothetical protein
MTTETPRTGLPFIAAAQAQKHVTHNEALAELDALLGARFLDRDLAAPPASPSDGDAYLVHATATGAWASQEGKIAFCLDGNWRFYAPFAGLVALVIDEGKFIAFDGSAWNDYAAYIPLDNVAQLGVNASADATNKLAVKSNAVLFAALETASSGTGDIRFTVNKETTSNTASLLFQDAFSGRAEIGLAGDDDFHFKVSPDGSTWTEALVLDQTTGLVTLAGDPTSALHAATKQYVDANSGGGGGGGGEANTASNVGTLGTGVFKQKSGVDLQFKKLNAASTKLSITDDTTNSKIDIDIAPANIAISSLSGAGALAAKSTVGSSDITNAAVTYAKIQNVSATDKILGRASAGAGTLEEIACTAAGRALLDDANAAAMVTTLGLDNTKIAAITFVIDGGGSAITTGVKGDLLIPFDCTINSATLLADQSGSIVIDIWNDTYSNYPPTNADSIAASAKPTLSSAIKSQDATLTGWTASITAGQILRFNVDSASTLTRVTLALKVVRT